MVEELGLALFGSEVRHEVAHRLAVDVVVTCDAAHVRREDSLRVDVIADQLLAIEALNRGLYQV